MPVTAVSERFTALPDDETLAETIVALEERGFGIDVADDLEAARAAVLARIPKGASVLTDQSVTLAETGIATAIDHNGQLQKVSAVAGRVDFALGTVGALTRSGILMIASASGRELASYASGAAHVIFVVGAQKLVPDVNSAVERIFHHSLPLEDARTSRTHGTNSRVGKILEIHHDDPGRIHIVLVRLVVGS